MTVHSVSFWIHLTLGIGTGLVGALMAGTAVIMAFADSYVDFLERNLRSVNPPANAEARSLDDLLAEVQKAFPREAIDWIGLSTNSRRAYEFYSGQEGLIYVDPYSAELRPSKHRLLRRNLHKSVEQWHRFFGLSGDKRAAGKFLASWFNVAMIPLFISGLILWWPPNLRWRFFVKGLNPTKTNQGRGTQRSWHTALGFWTLPLLMVMVVTATTHSFEWVRQSAYKLTGTSEQRSNDSFWAFGLSPEAVAPGAQPLSLESLRAIADQQTPGWTRLDLLVAPEPEERGTSTTQISVKVPGWGPDFFPVVLQVDPFSGEIRNIHSWDDLSSGGRLLAWSRWLHKGDAFGRAGQIVAGLACVVLLFLIVTGWSLAMRRLAKSLDR